MMREWERLNWSSAWPCPSCRRLFDRACNRIRSELRRGNGFGNRKLERESSLFYFLFFQHIELLSSLYIDRWKRGYFFLRIPNPLQTISRKIRHRCWGAKWIGYGGTRQISSQSRAENKLKSMRTLGEPARVTSHGFILHNEHIYYFLGTSLIKSRVCFSEIINKLRDGWVN